MEICKNVIEKLNNEEKNNSYGKIFISLLNYFTCWQKGILILFYSVRNIAIFTVQFVD